MSTIHFEKRIPLLQIWYNAVLRGDTANLEIGEGTNIQDRAVIVTSVELKSDYPLEVSIGNNVTIGHGALLTSCTLGDHVLIGQGAIVQQGEARARGGICSPDVTWHLNSSLLLLMICGTTKTSR